MEALSPVPGSLQIDATSAAEGTPGGSWRPLRLMAACSDSTPIGRPSPGRASAWPTSASGRRCARRTSSSSATVAAADRLRAGRRRPVRPRPSSSNQLADTRARLQLPRRRARSTCASTPRAAVPAAQARRRARREGAARPVPSVRRGTDMLAASPAPSSSARRREPIETAAQLAEVVDARRPAPPRGRRRVHPATRVFQALRIAVNRELETLPVALAAAVDMLRAGRPPRGHLATTRSRTASSSASSPPSGAAASARPKCRCASAAARRAWRRSASSRSGRAPPRRSTATPARAAPCCAPRGGSPHEQGGTQPRNVAPPPNYGRRQHDVRERRDEHSTVLAGRATWLDRPGQRR